MIALIAAVSKNGVIGNKGKLPWKLSTDLKRFAELTRGRPVIMGRKTFESIMAQLGKPLPGRKNIVLTRETSLAVPPEVHVVHSVEEAIKITDGEGEVFVIGGEAVYRSFFPHADRLYLTEVQTECEGDARFPEWDRTDWALRMGTRYFKKDDMDDFDFVFLEYVRKPIPHPH
nr:Dihydrofolate reductase [uncultured bacterium]